MSKSKDKIMNKEKSDVNMAQNKNVYKVITFIPLFIILGIVPLIIRLKIQTVTGQDMSYAQGEYVPDFYSYWKAAIICVSVSLMIIISFLFYNKKDFKKSKCIKVAYISIIVLAIITIMAAIFSSHKSLVWWGTYDRREGAIIWMCYLMITLYGVYFYKQKDDYKYVVIPLAIMIFIETMLITFEMTGTNFVMTAIGQNLIIPNEYAEMGTIKVVSNKGTGSLYNSNFVGSFVSLLMPMFLILCVKIKDIKMKSVYGITALGLFVLLAVSGSRAGIVGIGIILLVGTMLFAGKLAKNRRILGTVIAVMLLLGFALNAVTGGILMERIASTAKDAQSLFSKGEESFLENSPIKEILVVGNSLVVKMSEGKELVLEIADSSYSLLDENGANVDYIIEEDVYITPIVNLPVNIKYQLGEYSEGDSKENVYVLEVNDDQFFMVKVDENGNLETLDKQGNPIVIEPAEYIGLEGKETIGSNRGYLWSRSLPILRDNLILGVGPDAFVAEFPNGDKLAIWNLYKNAGTLVDKPHNLYLQIGINQGIIALLSFLVLNITYIVNSFKVYKKKNEYSFHDMFGIGIMLGIVGYLGAGMFNDSVVSVAPLYWCLLGIGFAVNYINSDNQE